MSLVSIAYEVFQKPGHRRILFTAIDDQGQAHRHGPIITYDGRYDPEKTKEGIRQRMEASLAQVEERKWEAELRPPEPTRYATREDYLNAVESWATTEKTRER